MRSVIMALVAVFALLLGGLLPLQAATAANSPVNSASWVLKNTGTAPFDASDGPGLDSSPDNGIVRTNDTATWEISYAAAASGPAKFVATLPYGSQWTANSATPQVCNAAGGGKISSDKLTLTCNRTVAGEVAQFQVTALVGALGNGQTFAPSLTIDGNDYGSAQAVTVSAKPMNSVHINNSSAIASGTVGGVPGYQKLLYINFGAPVDPNNINARGYAPWASTFSFHLSAPVGASFDGVTIPGGTVAVTQNGPTDWLFTVSMTPTSGLSFVSAAGNTTIPSGSFTKISAISATVFMPQSGVTPNVPFSLTGQISGFNPDSITGQPNLGGAFPKNQEPGAACVVSTQYPGNCYQGTINITSEASLSSVFSGAFATSGAYLFGDQIGITGGPESYPDYSRPSLVPGQGFLATNGIANAALSTAAGTGTRGSQVWGASQLKLSSPPQLRIYQAASSVDFYRFQTGVLTPPPLDASNYVIEYTDHDYGDDAGRRAMDAYGDAAIQWVSDPSQLAGGITSATAIRYEYLGEIAPGTILGVATPLQVTETPLAVGQTANWFFQYSSSDKPLVKSTYTGTPARNASGGFVRVSPALVRNTASWLQVDGATYAAGNAERGDVATLRITPTVIGPASGPDTIAQSTTIKVTMPSACLEPVAAAIPANGVLTPGIPGSNCNAGTPATISFDFGDLPAVAGAPGPLPYQGHAVDLTPIDIPVRVGLTMNIPSTLGTRSVVASTSDASAEALSQPTNDPHVSVTNLTVSGASVFKLQKLATTTQPGFVSPGETLTYTISWANASNNAYQTSQFVDVLPFNGDNRGTTGLSAPLVVGNIAASMADASQGTVSVEYSTDIAASIQAQLLIPGNETAASGVTWITLALGAIPPAGTTALRFTPSKALDTGFSGSTTVTVTVPPLSLSGILNNNVALRALSATGTPVVSSAGATRSIRSSSALISGSVMQDADFSGTTTPADFQWPDGELVQFVTGSGSNEHVVDTAPISADGSYTSPPLPAGTYHLRVSGLGLFAWDQFPATAQILPGQTLSGQNILVQEHVPSAVLTGYSANVTQGHSITIDVTDGDSLPYPSRSGSAYTLASGVSLPDMTTAKGGTVALTLPAAPKLQDQVIYTPPVSWPASAEGQTSYEDTFSYAWTNAQGAVSTATVTVTVFALPNTNDSAKTIPGTTSNLDVLADASGDGLTLDTAAPPTTTVSDIAVSYEAGKLRVVPTHVWGATETVYIVPVVYSIRDSHGQTAQATVTLTIQRAPVVTNTDMGSIGVSSSRKLNPSILNVATLATPTAASIKTQPALAGTTAQVTADGSEVTLSSGTAAGQTTFVVTYTDSLGQSTDVTLSARVLAQPTASAQSIRVGKTDTATFAENVVTDAGGIASRSIQQDVAPGVGTVTVPSASTTGNVVFTPDVAGAVAGVYPIVVRYTDQVGQTVDVTYTVTVQEAPSSNSSPELAIIGVGGSVTFAQGTVSDATLVAGTLSSTVNIAPGSGNVTVDQTTGIVRYDAAGVAPGTYGFSILYTDQFGQIGTWSYSVTVNGGLVLGAGEEVWIPEQTSHDFGITVTGVGATLSIVSPSAGASVSISGTTATFAAAQAGDYTFDVQADDGINPVVTESYTVHVLAPILGTAQSLSTGVNVAAGTIFTEQLTVGDGGIANRQVTTPIDPAAGVVTVAPGSTAADPGTVSFIPLTGGATPGAYTFVVSYADEAGQVVPVTYTLTLIAAPQAMGGTATVGEGKSITFPRNVISSAPGLLSDSVQIAAAEGSATVDPVTGAVTYSAGNAAAGPHTFTVTYTDQYGQQGVATYTVTVQAVLSVDGLTSGIIGLGKTIPFATTVTTAGTLTGAVVSSQPAFGTVSVDPVTGTVSYTATATDAGQVQFDVDFTDDQSQTVTVTFIVTVIAPAVINGGQTVTAKVAMDGTVSFPEAIQTNGVIVARAVSSLPAQGNVILGSVIFEAIGAAAGTYPFEVTYTDNVGQQTIAKYEATVQARPIGTGKTIEVEYGTQSVAIDPIGDSIGVNLRALAAADVTAATWGVASIVTGQGGTQLVVYTPANGWSGRDSFSVTVTDDLGQTVTLGYTVTVKSATGGGEGGQETNGSGGSSSSRSAATGSEEGGRGVGGSGASPVSTLSATGSSSETMLLLGALGLILAGLAAVRVRRWTARS